MTVINRTTAVIPAQRAHEVSAVPVRLLGRPSVWGSPRRDLRRLSSVMEPVVRLWLLICVGLVSAPITLAPAPGVDPSWMAMLNLVRDRHLRFGSEVVFTYGPWGYLDTPLAVSRLSVVTGIVFAALSVVVAWTALWYALARALDARLAAVAATAIVVLVTPTASALMLLGLVLVCLLQVWAQPRRPWVLLVAAVPAALLVQVKFSEGLLAAGAVVVASLVDFDRRRVMGVAGALVGAFTFWWLLAGQSLPDIPVWIRGSLDVAAGYADSMALDPSGPHSSYLWTLAAIVVLAALTALAVRSGHRDQAAATVAIVGATLCLGFKESTIRFDAWHQFFVYVWAIPVAVWLATRFRRPLVVAPLLLALVWHGSNAGLYRHPHDIRARWADAVQAMSTSHRNAVLDGARANATAWYQVPDPMLAAMAHHPVTVDGYEQVLGWMYGLDWQVPPMFQIFLAHTARLDQRNADWLARTPADQQVLRPLNSTIDGRNPLWDTPAWTMRELCSFRPIQSSPAWLLLGKAADHCGSASAIGSSTVPAGTTVPVPGAPASGLLVMSFRADKPGLLTRLQRLVDKPHEPLLVTVNGVTYRLPRALAGGPLVLSMPDAGWPAPFTGGLPYRNVSFSEPGTVTFSTVPWR